MTYQRSLDFAILGFFMKLKVLLCLKRKRIISFIIVLQVNGVLANEHS